LASKLVATVSSGLASKSAAMVFTSLVSKLAVGFLVEPQNQGGRGFPGLGLKTASSGLLIWASKYCNSFLIWASKPSGLRFFGCATKPTEESQHGTRVKI
jgi:hypothetical protein